MHIYLDRVRTFIEILDYFAIQKIEIVNSVVFLSFRFIFEIQFQLNTRCVFFKEKMKFVGNLILPMGKCVDKIKKIITLLLFSYYLYFFLRPILWYAKFAVGFLLRSIYCDKSTFIEI